MLWTNEHKNLIVAKVYPSKTTAYTVDVYAYTMQLVWRMHGHTHTMHMQVLTRILQNIA